MKLHPDCEENGCQCAAARGPIAQCMRECAELICGDSVPKAMLESFADPKSPFDTTMRRMAQELLALREQVAQSVPCRHEWYNGACVHCNVPAVNGRAFQPRFENVSCSQCGCDFGPGDHGYSDCQSHLGRRPI